MGPEQYFLYLLMTENNSLLHEKFLNFKNRKLSYYDITSQVEFTRLIKIREARMMFLYELEQAWRNFNSSAFVKKLLNNLNIEYNEW